MGVEGGFGDIDVDLGRPMSVDQELNIAALKLKSTPARPMFLNGGERSQVRFDELSASTPCECERWNQDKLPFPPIGNRQSRLVFVTSAPLGYDYEHEKLFPPKTLAGDAYDSILESLSVQRDQVYLTAALYCQTVSRGDDALSLMKCMRFKEEEFKELTKAQYFITLGSQAFQMMTGIFGFSSSYLGYYYKINLFDRDAVVIPLPHPSAIAESQIALEKTLRVLEKLRKV